MSASVGLPKVPLRQTLVWILLWLSLCPSIASAQACRIPDRLTAAPAERPQGQTPRIVPITGYILALSWSPQYCRRNAADMQCDGRAGAFGFILHGLWPEGAGRDYPQWCAAPKPVSEAMLRAQFCIQPSTRLMVHEWAKHGTCATSDPADYFNASRKLFQSVRFPDMAAASRRPLDVGGFKRLMSAANPRIPPSALIVTTDRDGDWLREVRVCLTKAMLPEPCPRTRSRGAPDGTPLKIWRGGA